MKKRKVKMQALLLSTVLFTAMLPTTVTASSSYEGAVTLMMNSHTSNLPAAESLNERTTPAVSLSKAISGSTISMQSSATQSSTISTSDSSVSNATSGSSSSADAGLVSDKKAVPKLSKTKAEELVRKNINIPEDYTLQSVNLSTNRLAEGSRNIWSLEFVMRANGKHMGSIYASIDADSGQIINFGSYNNNPNVKPSYPLKVEREAAQEIANAFIKEAAGSYVDEVTFNEHYGVSLLPALTGEVRHQFRFDRNVNGLPFLDNYIQIAVDSDGHVVEYGFVWDDTITFPKIDNYMTLEQAIAKLEEQGDPQLSYILVNEGDDKGKPMISYQLEPFAIDAISGAKRSEQPGYRYRMAGEVSDKPVTDKPLAAKPKAVELSEEQALNKVGAAFSLPKGAELSHASYNEYNDSDSGRASSSWNFSWEIKDEGKVVGSIWATVDGGTGHVSSYYSNNYSENANQTDFLPLDKVTSVALDTIKKQLPWLTNELYLIKPDSKQYEDMKPTQQAHIYIGFQRKLHNANIHYDNVNVTVDARTGEIVGFDAYIRPYIYPSEAPKVISKQEAMKKWMDYYRAELTYRVVNDYNWNGEPLPIEKINTLIAAGEIDSNNALEIKSKVELVYRLTAKPVSDRVFLDAQSGQWRTYENGDVTGLERQKVEDVEGHWAQHQLELMVAYKALDVVDGKVRPNELIKRGELIKMLVIARSGGGIRYETANTASSSDKGASFDDVAVGSQYFAFVEQALQQNLIDVGDGTFNPEGTVSREEMAELIVRALGYNSLAQYDDIFVEKFKDSGDVSKKGQATIVVGLNIMSVNKDGKFLPKGEVKRADAAVAFFRYLQARSDLQEAPLRM